MGRFMTNKLGRFVTFGGAVKKWPFSKTRMMGAAIASVVKQMEAEAKEE